jgi:hypothetical protein
MDHGLLRELNRIERHIAIELGESGKKREDAEKARASLEELMRRVAAGRQRVIKEREERDKRDESEGSVAGSPHAIAR